MISCDNRLEALKRWVRAQQWADGHRLRPQSRSLFQYWPHASRTTGCTTEKNRLEREETDRCTRKALNKYCAKQMKLISTANATQSLWAPIWREACNILHTLMHIEQTNTRGSRHQNDVWCVKLMQSYKQLVSERKHHDHAQWLNGSMARWLDCSTTQRLQRSLNGFMECHRCLTGVQCTEYSIQGSLQTWVPYCWASLAVPLQSSPRELRRR